MDLIRPDLTTRPFAMSTERTMGAAAVRHREAWPQVLAHMDEVFRAQR
jgi:hypothetical protein